MYFLISRISDYSINPKKPCKNAFKTEIPHIDIRIFQIPEEFNLKREKYEGSWLSKGNNHIIKNNHIERELEPSDKRWVININTLKELLELEHKVGKIILKQDYAGRPEIQIFDDYL